MIKLISSDEFDKLSLGIHSSDRKDFISWDLALRTNDDLILSRNSEGNSAAFNIRYFKHFIAYGQSSLLADERLHVLAKFGSKSVISLFMNEVPEYIKDDSILMNGLIEEIVSEFQDIFSSEENYGEIFPELGEVRFLKEFPRKIEKEYLYNYQSSFFRDSDLYVKKSGLNLEYSWDPHSLQARFSLWGIDYLLHRVKLYSGSDLYQVYRNDGVKVSEDDMKIINQALIYKLWKM